MDDLLRQTKERCDARIEGKQTVLHIQHDFTLSVVNAVHASSDFRSFDIPSKWKNPPRTKAAKTNRSSKSKNILQPQQPQQQHRRHHQDQEEQAILDKTWKEKQ